MAWGWCIYNIVESESDPLTRRAVDLFEKEPLKGYSEVHLHTPTKFGEDQSKDLGGDREQTDRQTNRQTDKRCSIYSMITDNCSGNWLLNQWYKQGTQMGKLQDTRDTRFKNAKLHSLTISFTRNCTHGRTNKIYCILYLARVFIAELLNSASTCICLSLWFMSVIQSVTVVRPAYGLIVPYLRWRVCCQVWICQFAAGLPPPPNPHLPESPCVGWTQIHAGWCRTCK